MGKRTGRPRGRPAGTKNPATITKEQGREVVREMVMREMAPMVEAQMAHAKGIKFLVSRAKAGGKFERVSEAQLDSILRGQDDGSIVLEIWDKEPSVQAFTDLMNRALDKPKEQAQEIDLKVSGTLVERLQAARKRVSGR